MKRISKIISILLSTLMILSVASVISSAEANCQEEEIKNEFCADGKCGNIQIPTELCISGNCDLDELIKNCFVCYPNGNCGICTGSASCAGFAAESDKLQYMGCSAAFDSEAFARLIADKLNICLPSLG